MGAQGPIAALEAITNKTEGRADMDGTYSVLDLCRLSGRGIPYVRNLLREAMAAGLWETVQVSRAGIDGRVHRVIAYRARSKKTR